MFPCRQMALIGVLLLSFLGPTSGANDSCDEAFSTPEEMVQSWVLAHDQLEIYRHSGEWSESEIKREVHSLEQKERSLRHVLGTEFDVILSRIASSAKQVVESPVPARTQAPEDPIERRQVKFLPHKVQFYKDLSQLGKVSSVSQSGKYVGITVYYRGENLAPQFIVVNSETEKQKEYNISTLRGAELVAISDASNPYFVVEDFYNRLSPHHYLYVGTAEMLPLKQCHEWKKDSWVREAIFLPSSSKILILCEGGNAFIYDIDQRETLFEFREVVANEKWGPLSRYGRGRKSFLQLGVSSDLSMIYSLDHRTTELRSLIDFSLIKELKVPPNYSLEKSSLVDEQLILIKSDSVYRYDLESEEESEIPVDPQAYHAQHYNYWGPLVVPRINPDMPEIRISDLYTGAPFQILPLPQGVKTSGIVMLSRDGRRLTYNLGDSYFEWLVAVVSEGEALK